MKPTIEAINCTHICSSSNNVHSQISYLRIFRIIFQLYFDIVLSLSLFVFLDRYTFNHNSYKTHTASFLCAQAVFCALTLCDFTTFQVVHIHRKMPMTTSRQTTTAMILSKPQNHKRPFSFALCHIYYDFFQFLLAFIHTNDVQKVINKSLTSTPEYQVRIPLYTVFVKWTVSL